MPSSPVYEKQGKPDLAIEQFTRAIALKPDWSPLYRGRAKVLQASGGNDPRGARRPWPISRSRSGTRKPTIRSWPWTTPIAACFSIMTSASTTPSRRAGSRSRSTPDCVDAHVLQVQSLLKCGGLTR